jgi:transcriptional regulator with XRE-family HTH domain
MARKTQAAEAPPSGAATGVEGVSVALGARIRDERLVAGLTVRGLAARTGVSPSLISQIERGRATPSVATLWSIARELGLSIADLFDGEKGSTLRRTHTASPLQEYESRSSITLAEGVRWERLTPTHDEEVDFLYVVYPVGAASCPDDALNSHGGREFGYVISGTLGVKVGFDEYTVRENDSISFDATMPHRLWAIGDEPVRAIWMVINRRGDRRTGLFD